MTTLSVDFTFEHAPSTTLQTRLAKGIEQLYYLLLFLDGSEQRYDLDNWSAWLERGLDVAIQSPPPGIAPTDRVKLSVRAPSRTPVVKLTGGDPSALGEIASLLRDLDQLRIDMPDADRGDAEAVIGASVLSERVVTPMSAALRQDGLDDAAVDRYLDMIGRAGAALTDRRLNKMEVSLS